MSPTKVGQTGAITEEEFTDAKARLINGPPGGAAYAEIPAPSAAPDFSRRRLYYWIEALFSDYQAANSGQYLTSHMIRKRAFTVACEAGIDMGQALKCYPSRRRHSRTLPSNPESASRQSAGARVQVSRVPVGITRTARSPRRT